MSKARANVTEVAIRQWFASLKEHLTELGALDVLEDPTRIFNCDETNVQLCPSTGKVIGIKGWKNVYELTPGPEKSTLTFVGTFSAAGEIVTPAIIYPYVRVPADIVNSVPENFFIGNTESGWMKAECWYEFIANAFIPHINKQEIQKPVILFVDGHSTHTSLQVSQLCEENGVILYLLPPNTTHILQPADVGPFRPLKAYWSQAVHKFQLENPNCVVRRQNVAPLLKDVLAKIKPSSIRNGFSATGIYPCDPDKPDYSKCLELEFEDEAPERPQLEATQSNGEEAAIILTPEEQMACQTVIKKVFGDNVEGYKTYRVSELWSLVEKAPAQNPQDGEDMQAVEDVIQNIDATGNILQIENTAESIVMVVDGEEFPINLQDNTNGVSDAPCNDIQTADGFLPLPESSITAVESTESVLIEPVAENPIDVSSAGTSNNLQPISKSACGQDDVAICSTGSSVLDEHIFWSGQIIHKKHKNPTQKIPSLISSEKFRKFLKDKEEAKLKTKKKKNDWICKYCSGSFSADKKAKRECKWINCDSCNAKMHITCVPERHLHNSGYESNDEGDEVAFLCETCFPENDAQAK